MILPSVSNLRNNKLAGGEFMKLGKIISYVLLMFVLAAVCSDRAGAVDWTFKVTDTLQNYGSISTSTIPNPVYNDGSKIIRAISPGTTTSSNNWSAFTNTLSNVTFYAQLEGTALSILASGPTESALRALWAGYWDDEPYLVTDPVSGNSLYQSWAATYSGGNFTRPYDKSRTLLYRLAKDTLSQLKGLGAVGQNSALAGNYTYDSVQPKKVFVIHYNVMASEYGYHESLSSRHWPWGNATSQCKYHPSLYVCEYSDGDVTKIFNFSYQNPAAFNLAGYISNDNSEWTKLYADSTLLIEQVNSGGKLIGISSAAAFPSQIKWQGHKTWSTNWGNFWYAVMADSVSYTGTSQGNSEPVTPESLDIFELFNFSAGPVSSAPIAAIPGKGWQMPTYDLGATNFYPSSSTAFAGGLGLKWQASASKALTGDVNGDGFLEVVTTNGSFLKVLDKNGAALAAAATPATLSVLADVTGDNIPEIFLSYRDGFNNLKIDIYQGNGAFIKTINRGASGYDSSWEVRAVIGDKILTGEYTGYSLIPRGAGAYSYSSGNQLWYYEIGPCFAGGAAKGFGIGDINSDGKLEAGLGAYTCHNGKSANGTTDGDIYSIVINEDGQNVWTKKIAADWVAGCATNGWIEHTFADINGDGNLEVIAFEQHDPTYYPGTNHIHLVSNTGANLATFVGPDNGENWLWAIADMNNDGKKDIVVSANNEQRIYILDNQLVVLSSSAAGTGQVLAVNDINGDGNNEIISYQTSTSKIRVLGSDFTELYSYGVNNVTPFGKIVSDLDNDGQNELIVFTTVNQMYVLGAIASVATISGKVTKADGTTALPGAKVEVLQSSVVKASATVDTSGNYSLTIATGTYDIRASSNGYITSTQTGKTVASGQNPPVNFTLNSAVIIEKMVFSKNVSGDDYDIYIMNPDGNGLQQLTSGTNSDRRPRISPDGELIAFVRDAGAIYVMNPDGSDVHSIGNTYSLSYDLAWSTDSKKIYYTTGEGSTQIRSIAVSGGADTLVLSKTSYRFLSVDVSSDGNRLVYILDPSNWTPYAELHTFNLSTLQDATLLGNDGIRDFYARFSHDGQKIIWTKDTNSEPYDFGMHIWKMNTDGSGQTDLHSGANFEADYPVASPDDSQIVFARRDSASGPWNLWKMGFDGTNQAQITTIGGCIDTDWGLAAALSSPTGFISGKVTKADGTTAILGAKIEALQSSVVKASSTADASGNYSLTLAAGTYNVRASSTGYVAAVQTGKTATAGQTATVNFNLDTEIVGQPDLVVSTITVDCSTPTINQTVNVIIKVKNQGTAGANGTFWVDFYKNLSQSPAVSQLGNAYWSQSPLEAGATAQLTTSFHYDGGQYNLYAQIDSENNIAESNESNNIYGPVLVKEQMAGGWISGKVISRADGKAVQGAAIAAKQGGTAINSAATNIAGNYVLAIASGAYTLEATAPGYLSSSTAVSIQLEETKYKDFALSPITGQGVITGFVTKADGVTPIPNAAIKLSIGAIVVDTRLANAIGAYRFITSTGTYNLEANAAGYTTKVNSNITILDNQATAVNFALALANTPPEPVSELAALPLDNLKVFLSWTPSVSGDVFYYRIYYAAGALDYQTLYASVKDTISHLERSWTSPALNRSQNYYFSVRPVNVFEVENLDTNNEVENLDTNNIVSAAISETVSGVKAAIKVPQTGKKVSGNRLTIVAEAVQEPLNVSKIKFMYKASHLEDWESVPAADARHPNPAVVWPYFIHWDLADVSGNSLPDGNYDLKAVAYDKNNNPDPSPMTVTISINHVDKDIEEKLVDGSQRKTEKIHNEKDNTIKVGGAEADALTEVKVAAGALNQSSDYINVTINPSLASRPIGNLAQVLESRDVFLDSGQKNLSKESEITIPYNDANNDGVVDGTNIKADDLQVWYFNEATKLWKKEDHFTIDKTRKVATVLASHFSTFALVSSLGADLSNIKVYPSPIKVHDGHDRATFAGLTGKDVKLRIFNVAGEIVFEKEHISTPTYDWLLVNNSGRAAAGGVYIYALTDNTGGKATGKFGVIR